MLSVAKESIMDSDKHIARTRLSRTFVVVVASVVATGAAVLASPVVMPRIIRRHPDWLSLGFSRDTPTSGAGARVVSIPSLRFSPMRGVAAGGHTGHRWVLLLTVRALSCRFLTAAKPTGAAT